MIPAAKHAADYHPYDLKIVPHTAVAALSDYSTMSAAGVTHFFHGQVNICTSEASVPCNCILYSMHVCHIEHTMSTPVVQSTSPMPQRIYTQRPGPMIAER